MSLTLTPVLAASCETLAGDIRRVAHGDEGVGVGRVAGHRDADVIGGVVVEGFSLTGEDRTVDREQVAALHAWAARTGADEQCEVDAFEDGVRVVADLDAGQRRERAVVKLHDDALESLQCRRDLEQPQLHGSVRAEQCTTGDVEEQAVADLACGAGDGDLDGSSAHCDALRLAPLRARWMSSPSTLAAPHIALTGCRTSRSPRPERLQTRIQSILTSR